MDTADLSDKVKRIAERTLLPDAAHLSPAFQAATQVLENLPVSLRPLASDGRAGGLVEMAPNLPTLILPDLHARPGLLVDLLDTRPDPDGWTVLELLDQKRIQVLMVGDGPHTEGPDAAPRWRKAWTEFQNGWASATAMTEEMTLAFNAMEIVALMVTSFPGTFLFLKGNHDNILNEEGNGNHPFGKYAYEGQMAYKWTADFLGSDFVFCYDDFERAMPLAARGKGWLATHAEPAFAITPQDAIEARLKPEIIQALTWTANEAAVPDAVPKTLAAFLDPTDKPGVAFGGHRPVKERFALRAGGRFVQIHDLDQRQAALIRPGKAFDPYSDIIALG